MMKTISGFTIVELIIVIGVIGVLTALITVGYIGMQDKSTASAISSGLRGIDKALRATASEQQWKTWPLDTAIDPSMPAGNPTIQQLITDIPAFASYLRTAPTATNFPASSWTYDTNGTTKTACATPYGGTNVVVSGVSQTIADNVDKQLDDTNGSCGHIRYDSTNKKLIFALSYTTDLDK